MEIKNAKIESTMLGYEDHGILTCYLYLTYGSSGQGAGGFGLDDYDKQTDDRKPSKVCGLFVQRILKTVGVDKWEDLPGKNIRVKGDHARVHAIGHFLEDKWFEFKEEVQQLFKESE